MTPAPAPRQHPRGTPRWNQPTRLVRAVQRPVERFTGRVPVSEVSRWRRDAQEPPQWARWSPPGLGWALWLLVIVVCGILAVLFGIGIAFIRQGK